ncbi:MAG: Crp/Fnr family transcriptional regulator [Gammaproteobacteria bacterium]|nr:Crp/Fnr family transcriptional regulator [Gammaproteobacteria bacterium]
MARVDGHPPMELGMVGNEGMIGVSLLLGVSEAPQQAIVQAAGTALRIESAQLLAVLAESPGLLREFHRYFFDLLVQLSQTTVCTRFHVVEARLARWLLMTHDRSCRDRFQLTHQFLADLLGVQRQCRDHRFRNSQAGRTDRLCPGRDPDPRPGRPGSGSMRLLRGAAQLLAAPTCVRNRT